MNRQRGLKMIIERNNCQILGCYAPVCKESINYAMMCYEHYILWLEVKIPIDVHEKNCICSLCLMEVKT